MLKLPVKPPIVNENIDLSEYAKKSDVDAIGASIYSKEIVIKIRKVAGAKGYQIQYATNRKFKKQKSASQPS